MLHHPFGGEAEGANGSAAGAPGSSQLHGRMVIGPWCEIVECARFFGVNGSAREYAACIADGSRVTNDGDQYMELWDPARDIGLSPGRLTGCRRVLPITPPRVTSRDGAAAATLVQLTML